MAISGEDISCAITESELSGKTICLHSSLKSFGYLEGGADALIDAFLNKGCTIIVPAFYYDAKVCPPKEKQYKQNGCDYSELPNLLDSEVPIYQSHYSYISKEMGAIPKHILMRENSIRGNHPMDSFAAIGTKAKEIISCQKPLDIYAPYQELYKSKDAYILLAGVDYTKATPIHFAERLAGRRLFREWVKVAEGKAIEAEVGGCSEGFNQLEAFLSGKEKIALVGESLWRTFSFKSFIDEAVSAIKNNPMITHCNDVSCMRCRDAILGGPIIS